MSKKISLTSGFLQTVIRDEEWKGVPVNPLIQILSWKKIISPMGGTRYRLHISDGEYTHNFAMANVSLNYMFDKGTIENFAVVRVDKMCRNILNKRVILIIVSMEVVAPGSEVAKKLEDPILWPQEPSNYSSQTTFNNSGTFDITKAVNPASTDSPNNSSVSLSKLFEEIQSLRNTFFFAKMGGIELSGGFIVKALRGKETPQHPLIQLLDFKKIVGQEQQDRYRLNISDGESMYSFVMLSTALNNLITENTMSNFAVIQVDKMVCNTMNDKNIMILLSVKVVVEGRKVREKLGNPKSLDFPGKPETKSEPESESKATIPAETEKPSSMSLSKLFDEIQQLEHTFLFSRLEGIELTRGCLAKAIKMEGSDSNIMKQLDILIQILGIRRIEGNGKTERFRVHVSDGEFSHNFAFVSDSLNHLFENKIIENFAVIRVKEMVFNTIHRRKVLLILALEVVAPGDKLAGRIGNPIVLQEHGQDL